MADKIIRCPECGHIVQSFFDHVDIDCEHDMTEEEIAALQMPAIGENLEKRREKALRTWNMDAIRAANP